METTITTMATTAPSSAERTGAALAPRPSEPRADRRPSTALGESPAAAAALFQAGSCYGGCSPWRTSRCGATRYATSSAAAVSTTMKNRSPKPSTVQSKETPMLGVDGPDRPERGQRGQRDGDRHREQRPRDDRAEDAEERVGHDHGRPGSQGAHDRALVLVPSDEAADHLAVDHQGRQRRDETEDPDGDGLGPDGPFGFRHVRRPGLSTANGPEVGDDLVHGGDNGRLRAPGRRGMNI